MESDEDRDSDYERGVSCVVQKGPRTDIPSITVFLSVLHMQCSRL